MISASKPNKPKVRSFRTKLLAAMMLVVSGLMALALYLAQRHVAAAAQSNLQQNFQAELLSLDKVRELRNAALAERCGALASRPRIHAALEDNALDLLYPSAKDELRDLMEPAQPSQTELFLRAKFYRFLNPAGKVLSPPNPKDVGELSPKAETQLTLKKLPERQQIGYILETPDATDEIVDEIVAAPIFSTETGDVISTLVVGFKPFDRIGKAAGAGTKSGIWLNGQLRMTSLSKSSQAALGSEIAKAITNSDRVQNNFRVIVDGAPQLLFYKRLNPTSLFPPAYEICVYPLADSMAHLHRLRWQIGFVGVLLLLGGFVASQFVAARLSLPVEKLAVDSEKDRAQRKRAEAALASTSEELKRSARYSADASHQLKSPVTVLRVGVEKLLEREDFKPDVYEELSALLHQTHRLTGVIDDLLLLSRMDAGHLQIASAPVDVSQLVDEWLDDLGALPDSPDVKIEKEFPAGLFVAGEKRYTSLIVQNLLENARKYNRPGGRIRVSAHSNAKDVVLTVGNTGHTIPPGENIFERFHHSSTPSAASGHGIGLNLARQLARLHGGNLRLVRSEDDWTEFEVRFPAADGFNAVA
jgi:signal transduction histidine kinase/type II secretory pathway pseudopilin PulG